MYKLLQSTVRIAHQCLSLCLEPGSVAVDATVGNGKDTLFLAQLVTPGGQIYGFDVQPAAIKATADLLAKHGFTDNVRLINTGHENLRDFVTGQGDAVLFNLGYLPGGNHEIVTRAESTVFAVKEAVNLLKPGGVVLLVVYTGHPEGVRERDALEAVLRDLDKDRFCVGKLDFLNRENAPYLIIIGKSLQQHGEDEM